MNKKLKSLLGYRKDSPFKDEPYLVIESNNISMDNVDKDLILLPNKGKPVIAKANSGGYLFPNASRVKEIPLKEYQSGGVSMKPVSPFIDLKMFKNRYKMPQLTTYQEGGILDNYIKTLPEEQQNVFMGEFQSLEPDVQKEVIFMLGGFYQPGGKVGQVENMPYMYLGKSKGEEFYYDPYSDRALKRDTDGFYIPQPFGKTPADLSGDSYAGPTPNEINKHLEKFPDRRETVSPSYSEDLQKIKQDYLTFLNAYYNSPDIKRRLKNEGDFGARGPDEILAQRKNRIAQDYNVSPSTESRHKGNSVHIDTTGREDKLSKSMYGAGSPVESVTVHELSHGVYLGSMTPKEKGLIKSGFKNKKAYAHDKDYNEIKADLSAIKYELYKDGTFQIDAGLKINMPTLKKIKEKYKDNAIFKRTFDNLTEDVILKHINDYSMKESSNVPIAQQGGMFESNAELEDKETLVTPDGELSKIEGKTHAEGGEMVNIPDQTRIYSHYLKAPQEVIRQVLGKESKKKMSYADLSKKFPTKNYMEILDNPDSDQYQRNSAQIKLMNNLSKLDTIFFAQEQEKKFFAQEQEKKTQGRTFQPGGQIDWTTGQIYQPDTVQYPTIHQEPYPTVSTGVRQILRNPKLDLTYDLDLPQVDIVASRNQPVQTTSQVRGNQSKQRSKPNTNSAGDDSALLEIPLPFGQLPTADLTNAQIVSNRVPEQSPTLNDTTPSTDEFQFTPDDKSYPERAKDRRFGISSKLAGTVADIGLALSDKLRVSEPTLYDRRKYPLFTRFVDFDDKEVQRMYDKGIQQIQNSNLPEAQKQAQIAEMLGKYQDYQGKVDYNNLQRYEGKREQDTNKLQSYLDRNVDIKVADTESYRERKARVNELRDAWNAQRKTRIVNSLKAYANYADQINYANQLYAENYTVSPITGLVKYKPNQQSELKDNLLQQYAKNAQNKISFGNGLTGYQIGQKLVVTNADGTKFEVVNIE